MAGSGLRALGTLRALERRLRRPVLSANQLAFWAALRSAKITAKVTRYGRLFSRGNRRPQP